MASGADYEGTKNYVHASWSFCLPRQRIVPTVCMCKLPEAFGLTVAKSLYPHYFNTLANLDYVGKIPDITYYGVDEMSRSERNGSSRSTGVIKKMSLITNESWKRIVRTTWVCCGKNFVCWGVNSYRYETSTCLSNPSLLCRHVIGWWVNGSSNLTQYDLFLRAGTRQRQLQQQSYHVASVQRAGRRLYNKTRQKQTRV